MATRGDAGGRRVIPEHMNPPVAAEIIEREGERYLQTNEAMFTFYKRTKGEFSKYFLGLRDEFTIYGAKCRKCRTIRVPPFALMCPDCEFAEMDYVAMPDRGVMNSTPPITYFAHSLFQAWVPFGRGRVVLEGAETALPMQVFTTKGVLTPFIFKRGTPVKIVFRDERAGKPTDIFAVPLSELTAGQQAKSPLMESHLDFSKPSEPPTGKPTEAKKAAFRRAMGLLNELAASVDKSPRARHNLAGWKRVICWKTAGGNATLRISDGRLAIAEGAPRGEADLVMISENPQLLIDWMTFKEALTNAIIGGKLWISLNREFTTVFKLDRLPRSVHRDRR